jgi:hypothetical protein
LTRPKPLIDGSRLRATRRVFSPYRATHSVQGDAFAAEKSGAPPPLQPSFKVKRDFHDQAPGWWLPPICKGSWWRQWSRTHRLWLPAASRHPDEAASLGGMGGAKQPHRRLALSYARESCFSTVPGMRPKISAGRYCPHGHSLGHLERGFEFQGVGLDAARVSTRPESALARMNRWRVT